MRKTLLAVACLLVGGAAQAQEYTGFQLRPFVAGGLTVGGDKLDTVYYANDSSVSLHGGNLLHVMAGVDARITPMWSLQFNAGYQVDYADGNNGSLRFERVPLELLGYYHATPAWKIGLGARYSMGARVAGSGVLASRETGFKVSAGSVVEVEYAFTERYAVRLRYVTEKYEPDAGGDKVDGSHVGLLFGYYF
jgi:hypothetical protein